jgi:hypothetical protein
MKLLTNKGCLSSSSSDSRARAFAARDGVDMVLFQPGEKVEDVSRHLSTCENYST